MTDLSQWKAKLKTTPQFGCFITFASPAITEFTAQIGFDFTLIDNEHGCMNQETVEDMVRASQCANVPAIVRIPYNRAELGRRALDFGANGIQIPLIDTKLNAEEVASYSHFEPNGKRGVAFLTRAANYGMTINKKSYLEQANENNLVVIHIETVEALNNLDEILAVDGIDVLFVGPGDLAISMGYADNPNDKKVIQTINSTLQKISDAGKIAGTYVNDSERAKQVIECGAKYIVTSLNHFMINGAKDFLAKSRVS